MTVNVLPAIPAAGLTHAICTKGVELTVRAMVVDADKVPEAVPVEVPWMVMVAVPTVAVELAVNERRLEPVVGFVANAEVTPLGIPDAVKVTAPVNPLMSVTLMVSLTPELRLSVRAGEEGAMVKLPVPEEELTVSAMEVDSDKLPDAPVMVSVEFPTAAVAVADSVRVLLPDVGLVPNASETPEGKPDTVRVTLPLNAPTSVTRMLSVAVLP
jgi:hypothetical protein